MRRLGCPCVFVTFPPAANPSSALADHLKLGNSGSQVSLRALWFLLRQLEKMNVLGLIHIQSTSLFLSSFLGANTGGERLIISTTLVQIIHL
jgi:hypothetical protein